MVVITELKTFPTLSRESLLLNNPKQAFSGKPNPDAEKLRILCCGCAAAAVGGFEDNIPEERVVCHPPASPTSKGTSWNQNLEYEFLAVDVEEED